MSYDFSINDVWLNYTSNGCSIFYDHIPDSGKGGGLRELDNIKGKEAAIILGEFMVAANKSRLSLYVDYAVGEPEFCRKYDSPNGWGSAIGAILFAGQMMHACIVNPDEIVSLGF